MKLRAPLVALALAMTTAVALPPTADAQGRRVAVPRSRVVVRPPPRLVRPTRSGQAVVVRPRATVFIGGYYFPSLYRTTLSFGYGRPYPYYYGSYGFGRRSLGVGGYSGAPYYYQGPPYYGRYDLSGSIRLQVAPREAEVFVDGYYAGVVDDFDGIFQRLHVEAGEHDLELYLPGHRPFQQRIYVQPEGTFNIRHVMEPLGPGELEPARPAGAPLPPPVPRDPRDPRTSRVDPGAPSQGPQAAGFGQLSLRVQPGDATIVIDGEPWVGATDEERLVVELGAGVHQVEIRKDGYRSYFTDITIRGGETRTLNVALTPQ